MVERGCRSVGIDLGTTFSSLAYLDARLTPHVVADSSGQSVVPSVVFFDEDEIIVGDIALQQAKVHADRCIQFIKVHMGDEWRREIGGQVHTPESISALILAYLVREAELELGAIDSAVITVPAYFTEKRRRATQQAGEIAGLNVIGTLNEPMAAALAHGLYREKREQTVMVYDLGGGTFDVTIVRVCPTTLEELVTCGNRQLGGKDWDQCLIEMVCADFETKHRIDPRRDAQAMQDLQLACEQAKRRLSRMARTTIRVHADGRDHSMEVSRQDFETATAHLVQTTRLTAEMALEDAGLDWRHIDRVVLVGGSTHMPMIRTMLEQSSGRSPDVSVNPVTAVSMGAAIYAYLLENDSAPRAVRSQDERSDVTDKQNMVTVLSDPHATQIEEFQLEDDEIEVELDVDEDEDEMTTLTIDLPNVQFVTAHGVGVKAKAKGEWTNVVLIPKNSPVPATVSRQFYTKGTGVGAKRIRIHVTQGDTRDVHLAEVLGVACIEGLPPNEPPGQPVSIAMSFDDQGRLHLHALYVNTGQDLQLSLEIPGGLQEDEVERYRTMMKERGLLPPSFAGSVPPIQDFDTIEIILDEDSDDVPYAELDE